MKIDSVLKPKHMAWVSGAVLAVLLLIVLTRSGAEASVQAPLPIVEVATVEQRGVPVYGEWIGTLTGQVNADVKAQVTGYLLTRKYKEGSYVRKGELLFEIDPRPFQAAHHADAQRYLDREREALGITGGGITINAQKVFFLDKRSLVYIECKWSSYSGRGLPQTPTAYKSFRLPTVAGGSML